MYFGKHITFHQPRGRCKTVNIYTVRTWKTLCQAVRCGVNKISLLHRKQLWLVKSPASHLELRCQTLLHNCQLLFSKVLASCILWGSCLGFEHVCTELLRRNPWNGFKTTLLQKSLVHISEVKHLSRTHRLKVSSRKVDTCCKRMIPTRLSEHMACRANWMFLV